MSRLDKNKYHHGIVQGLAMRGELVSVLNELHITNYAAFCSEITYSRCDHAATEYIGHVSKVTKRKIDRIYDVLKGWTPW